MNIAIVGTGYVGLVSGACFAEVGVTCVDVDQKKVESLIRGEIPIYEPGLDEIVKRTVQAGRLHFTTDLRSCLEDVEVVFSAVGTPPDEDGSADLKHVLSVAREFGRSIRKYTILAIKSTVPVGTAAKVSAVIRDELDKRGENIDFEVVSNPEFLKEGAAVKDFLSPDRIIVGVSSRRAEETMTKLYRPFMVSKPRIQFMDIPSAEMTKYAANAMLATRISFMNDIAVRFGGSQRGYGTQGHRCGFSNREQVPLFGERIWRIVFPEGCQSLDFDRKGTWLPDAGCRGGRCR